MSSVWHGVAEWPQCSITAAIVVRIKQNTVYMYTHNLKAANQIWTTLLHIQTII